MWTCEIAEVGRFIHPTDPRLAASPDGIILKAADPTRSCRLIEIKCPISREITKTIPFDYWCQMQIQMEVTNLFECEYVEVELISVTSKQLTIDLSGNYLEKGAVYLIEKDSEYMYVYSDEEKNKYLENEYNLMETIPYGIKTLYNVCVKRDTSWYESTKEIQTRFWNDIEKANSGNYVFMEPRVKRQKSNECLIVEEPI